MKVGLFIPCYVDQFYPNVAIATLELLEKLGITVIYPLNQTCCGQPMANAGFEHLSHLCNSLFIENFNTVDYIVCPSGSCTLHIKEHLQDETQGRAVDHIRKNIVELTEFLTDIVQVKKISARFPHRVGLHQSCHGQRGLKLSQMSELVAAPFSKPLSLLKMVNGIELIQPERPDECCGFGGTFCITEEALSVKMGKDRISDHARQQVEYIVGGDMSCLMHLDGILRRQKSNIKVIHLAEILNSQ